MLTKEEKAYYQAIKALKDRNYTAASGFFRVAEKQFTDNRDFRILRETTELLLAVKDEIYSLENEKTETGVN
jgi:hypothetical protein